MKRTTKRLLAATMVFFVAGCETERPATDTTAPEIIVMVSKGHGNNIFRSIDSQQDPRDTCIKVPETPSQLVMIAGDSGGIQSAWIKASTGTIVPGSLVVTPSSPEASFSIRTDRSSDILEITLTPPSPGTVRTGATAILEVSGDLPLAIVAGARDYAGNDAALPQFDVRAMDDPVICRGDK